MIREMKMTYQEKLLLCLKIWNLNETHEYQNQMPTNTTDSWDFSSFIKVRNCVPAGVWRNFMPRTTWPDNSGDRHLYYHWSLILGLRELSQIHIQDQVVSPDWPEGNQPKWGW